MAEYDVRVITNYSQQELRKPIEENNQVISSLDRHISIYALDDPTNEEGTRYAGKTISLMKQRLSGHISAAKHGSHLPVHRWIKELLDSGVKPRIILLDIVVNGEDWELVEKDWIRTLRASGHDLLNIADGGDGGGMLGHITSEATRKKLSDASRGKALPAHVVEAARQSRLGSKHSAETRAKISERLRSQEINVKLIAAQAKLSHPAIGLLKNAEDRRGVPLTEEHRANIGKGNLGHRHTDQSKEKMSVAAKNRKIESLGFLGKIHRDDTKNLISNKLKQYHADLHKAGTPIIRVMSENQRKQISTTLLARNKKIRVEQGLPELVRKEFEPKRHFTLEHRASLSAAQKIRHARERASKELLRADYDSE